MDTRTIVATIAFIGALITGVGLGGWHGPSLAPDSTIGAPVAIASPLESAGGGSGGSAAPRPLPSSPARRHAWHGAASTPTPSNPARSPMRRKSSTALFSTIQLPDDLDRYTYERATNDAIAALADRYDNVRIFDWEAVWALHPEWIYAEGIHMTPEGCRGYADLVEPQIRAP